MVSAIGFVVEVMGKPGEKVELGAYHASSGAEYAFCTIGAEGTASFTAQCNGATCGTECK